MLTIVETPIFSKLVYDYLTDDEFAEFQVFLAENPEAGDVVPRSGGVRKIRWARRDMGIKWWRASDLFQPLIRHSDLALSYLRESEAKKPPAHILRAMKEAIENEW